MGEAVDRARGERVQAMRKARAMTQEALATAADVSPQTIKRAEAGKPVASETVQALCAVFGVEAGDILGTAPSAVTASGEVPPTPPASALPTDPWSAVRRHAGPIASGVLVLSGILAEQAAWGDKVTTLFGFRACQSLAVACFCLALAVVAGAAARRSGGARRGMLAVGAVAACCLAVEPAARLAADQREAVSSLDATHDAIVRFDGLAGDLRSRTIGKDFFTGEHVLDAFTIMIAQDYVLLGNIGDAEDKALVARSNDKERLDTIVHFTSLRDPRDGLAWHGDDGGVTARRSCSGWIKANDEGTAYRAPCLEGMAIRSFDRLAAMAESFAGGPLIDGVDAGEYRKRNDKVGEAIAILDRRAKEAAAKP